MDDSVCLCCTPPLSLSNQPFTPPGGPEGLRSLTYPKAIIMDRWPSVIQTSIPKVLDYPLRSMYWSWQFASSLARFLYGDNWRESITGLYNLTRAARQ